MRISLVILIFMAAIINLEAQAYEPQDRCDEIFILTKDAGSATIVIKAYTSSNALWHPTTHNLTTEYREQTLNITGSTMNCDVNGFDLSGDCSALYPQLGKNRYVISVENSNKDATVTIDANGCSFNGDIYLTYDWDDDKWYKGSSCQVYGTTPISSYVAYDDKSCLELFLTISNQNNHPRLDWNAYHTSVLHYKVYKKVSGSYNLLATTSNTYYVDGSEFLYSFPNEKTYVYYKISAQITSSEESLFGNEKKVAVNKDVNKEVAENIEIEHEINFELSPIYPNPFNPTTTISYQIPKSDYVTLRVFNAIGEEVAELVNGFESAGLYTVIIDGRELSSGMHYVVLRTNENYQVQKMLLIK